MKQIVAVVALEQEVHDTVRSTTRRPNKCGNGGCETVSTTPSGMVTLPTSMVDDNGSARAGGETRRTQTRQDKYISRLGPGDPQILRPRLPGLLHKDVECRTRAERDHLHLPCGGQPEVP
eukprot:scaffold112050_cov36-Tisochrysis_lutea.AAC.2